MSWNPLQDLLLLQDRMNRLFEDATQRRARGEAEHGDDLERADWCPPADVYETEDEFVVAADLPGIDRAALEITIDDNRLHIRGKRNLQAAVARSERNGGTFLRTFAVPNTVDQSKIRADYKDGVLEVHLPKVKEQKKQRVAIKIT